jgi:hypothetical protein
MDPGAEAHMIGRVPFHVEAIRIWKVPVVAVGSPVIDEDAGVGRNLSPGDRDTRGGAPCEADDYTDDGRITDKFLADPEGLAVTMESGTAEGPVVSWQPSTWMEIPL